MEKWKRVFCIISLVLIPHITVAAESEITIGKIKEQNGMISVEAGNNLEEDTYFTFMVEKEGIEDTNRYYAFETEAVKAKEQKVFIFGIDEEKNGYDASGTYKVKLMNLNYVSEETSFEYVTSSTMQKLVDDIKAAALKVTDKDSAYEKLGPIIDGNTNKYGIFLKLGVDYDELCADSDVKNDTLNYLYDADVENMNIDNASQKFRSAYALALYNSGEKADGISVLSVNYDNKKTEDRIVAEAIEIMDDLYSSVTEYEKGFTTAYGICTIKNANVGKMEEALSSFEKETGECGEIIEKLAAYSKKDEVYREVITKINKKTIGTADELEDILEGAYAAVKKENSGSGGGALSGGGSGGGRVNSVPVASAAIPGHSKSTDDMANENVMIFADIPESHWAAEAIGKLKESNIVNGTENNLFEPDRSITREEFTKMIVLACGYEISDGITEFSDVLPTEWYAPYIATALQNGIVKGTDENIFGVGFNITRQDMTVITERALRKKGLMKIKVREYKGFADEDEFSDYAFESIVGLYETGIINGKNDNRFDATGNATRAEAAKIIYEAVLGGN